MVFEHIENLKRIYTDQLVIVDDNRPELGRFQGLTGNVRTVNMSGRALVEFDGHNNIGWYDIDVDFLKLVDEPVHETETVSTPVPPAETPAEETPAEETVSPAEEKAAPAAVDAGSMSVADMLAAARASAAGESAPAAPKEEAEAAQQEEAPATEETPAPAAEAPAEETAAPAGDAGDAQALKDAGDVDAILKYCQDVDG